MISTTLAGRAPVRVRDTRDLLSVIPYLLGYRPRECVVVLCVRAGGELGLMARTELSELRLAAGRAEAAALVALRAGDDLAEQAWVVAYTAANPGIGGVARVAAGVFAAALAGSGCEVESWLVGPGRYWALDCMDRTCCPPEGFPVELLESTIPGAQLVLAGHAPVAMRADLYRIRRAPQAQRDLAGRAASRWSSALVRARSQGTEPHWRTRSFAAWQDAVHAVERGASPAPALLGRLATALMDWRVRDGVLIWFVPDGLQWAETIATGTESAGGSSGGDVDAAVARGLAGVLDVSAARRPDPGRLQPGEEILRAVVAHTIRERMVAPLTLLGFLSWWSGDQAGAAVRITEALSLDASYRLALLLNEAMNAGLAPGWVRARAAKGHATGVDGNATDRDCVDFGVRSRS